MPFESTLSITTAKEITKGWRISYSKLMATLDNRANCNSAIALAACCGTTVVLRPEHPITVTSETISGRPCRRCWCRSAEIEATRDS
jgi:hypothetical protein